MSKEKTKVVFRVWPDGDVIALFPQIPADQFGYMCESYLHVGEHGGADIGVVVSQTKPASGRAKRHLAHTLRMIGYHLRMGKRCTAKDRTIRRMEAQGTRLLLKY